MPPHRPMDARDVLDAYFLDTRARLLDIAATLDRIDRAPAPEVAIAGDPRLDFIRRALAVLQTPVPPNTPPARAEQIQRLYSIDG